MKTVQQIMEENGSRHNIEMFMQLQKMPYEYKVYHAEEVAEGFVQMCREREKNCHVSVGGLDSITLLVFLRNLGERHGISELRDIPAVSCSRLEDKSIQKIHKELGVIPLPPLKREDGSDWSKAAILQEFGFPVLSKEIAAKIELLQAQSPKSATVRHAIITGETGEYGGWQKNSRMKLSQKWLEKFGGYENDAEGVDYQIAPFKVSSKCCYYLKERPADLWAKEHNSVPFLGLMASEGGRREKSLKMNGCNYWGSSTIRSAPFAIFDRQDVLRLNRELGAPVPEIYGEIAEAEDGTLYTTKAQRTGCDMCGFGVHLEKRPHRFDLLRERNEKLWEFWMYRCCKDEDGTPYGWGRVLDYIGVEWENPPISEQISLFDQEGTDRT